MFVKRKISKSVVANDSLVRRKSLPTMFFGCFCWCNLFCENFFFHRPKINLKKAVWHKKEIEVTTLRIDVVNGSKPVASHLFGYILAHMFSKPIISPPSTYKYKNIIFFSQCFLNWAKISYVKGCIYTQRLSQLRIKLLS